MEVEIQLCPVKNVMIILMIFPLSKSCVSRNNRSVRFGEFLSKCDRMLILKSLHHPLFPSSKYWSLHGLFKRTRQAVGLVCGMLSLLNIDRLNSAMFVFLTGSVSLVTAGFFTPLHKCKIIRTQDCTAEWK